MRKSLYHSRPLSILSIIIIDVVFTPVVGETGRFARKCKCTIAESGSFALQCGGGNNATAALFLFACCSVCRMQLSSELVSSVRTAKVRRRGHRKAVLWNASSFAAGEIRRHTQNSFHVDTLPVSPSASKRILISQKTDM